LLIEDVSDLGVDVIAKEFVHELDNHGPGLHLLSGWLGVRRRQGLCLASLETNMDLSDSFRGQFDSIRAGKTILSERF
jgi:hypothetical protein